MEFQLEQTSKQSINTWKGDFGLLRTIIKDGEPWFFAADVCRALEILNPTDALTRLDDDEHTLVSTEGIPGAKNPWATAVSEAGLYTLVLGSRKPEAKAFKRWITHKVLPAIRKTGGYQVGPSTPRSFAEALRLAADQAEQIENQEQQIKTQQVEIAEMKPQVRALKQLDGAKGLHGIGMTAKQLNVKQTVFVQWLIDRKILHRRDGVLVPMAEHMGKGRFWMHTTIITTKNDEPKEVTTTKVAAAGLDWLSTLWMKDHPEQVPLQIGMELKPKKTRKSKAKV